MLDDEATGIPFLERCRALGTDLVCTHKGISALAPAGSPRDVGPAAGGFPDLRFVVYHSGYEMPEPGVPPEGAYDESSRDTTGSSLRWGHYPAWQRPRAWPEHSDWSQFGSLIGSP